MQTVRDVMTPDPLCLPSTATLTDAAREMGKRNIGDVLVIDQDRLAGMVTDRDIVVRGVAQGRDTMTTTLADVCTGELQCLPVDAAVGDAVRMMTDHAVRRVPVVDGERLVGIVSLGDLAQSQDPGSALADISQAQPNR